MNANFKDQSGAPLESAPEVTVPSEKANHHAEQNNTAPRKPRRRSAYIAQNKRTALLSEALRHSILADLKAGLGEQAIAISHGVKESEVRNVRKVHLTLTERVAAILHLHQRCPYYADRPAARCADDDIRKLDRDMREEEGAA